MDVGRDLTAVEALWLTGHDDAAGQRAACERMGVQYHRRRLPLPGGRGSYQIDECRIWRDARVDALFGGWSDPAIGRYVEHEQNNSR